MCHHVEGGGGGLRERGYLLNILIYMLNFIFDREDRSFWKFSNMSTWITLQAICEYHQICIRILIYMYPEIPCQLLNITVPIYSVARASFKLNTGGYN